MSEAHRYFEQLLSPFLTCGECCGRRLMEYTAYPKIEWTESGTGDGLGNVPSPIKSVEPCRTCGGTGKATRPEPEG